jgi:gamma-glutamyltranspeptidase
MGHIIKLGKLCNTLRQLSEQGGDSFYNGPLADLIAEDLKDLKSIITRNDLTTYK